MDVKATIHTLVGQPIIVGDKTFAEWNGDVLCGVDEESGAKLLSVNGWVAVSKPEPKPELEAKPVVEERKKKFRGRKEVAD